MNGPVFVSSRGYRVVERQEGLRGIEITDDAGANLLAGFDHLTANEVGAIGEYLQALSDERLGRWRWPEDSDFVVYPHENGGVWVHSEREPGAIRYASRDEVPQCWSSNEGTYVSAARAYFEAHPEPQPWHDAQPGEVWDIDGPNGGIRAVTITSWSADGPVTVFRNAFTEGEKALDDATIRDARRVWPEVSA